MKKYIGGLRIAAFLIDSLIITVGVLLGGFLLSSVLLKLFPTYIIPIRVFWGLMVLLGILYFLFRDGFRGRSVGKRILGLHVAFGDNKPCTPVKSFKRNIVLFVPLLNLVELYLFLRNPHQPRLGDRIAKTQVEET